MYIECIRTNDMKTESPTKTTNENSFSLHRVAATLTKYSEASMDERGRDTVINNHRPTGNIV